MLAPMLAKMYILINDFLRTRPPCHLKGWFLVFIISIMCTTYGGLIFWGEDLLLTSDFLLFPLIDFLLTSYSHHISSDFVLLTSYWFFIDLLFPLIHFLLASYWPLIDFLFTAYSSLIDAIDVLLTSHERLIDLLFTSYWPLETTNKCRFKVPWLCS